MKANQELNKLTPERIAAFWQRVKKSEGCWEWQGCSDDEGYGLIRINKLNILTHRFAFTVANKRVPKLDVLHTCDNPKCVKPAHLWEGTRGENNTDRASKGRSAIGEKHGCAKLSGTDVLTIKERIRQGESLKQISEDYPVNVAAISKIATGRTWSFI